MWPFTSSLVFDPEKNIPSLAGKIIIITGSNGGLGYESLIHLARKSPAKIYLCARTQEKYDAAMKGISEKVPHASDFVKFLKLDLASLAAVKEAANTFLAENDRLDVLMNNAGIMATPASLTPDGYEIQFGTNHVGHALFTKLLLPLLLKTAESPNSDVRIVNLTSEGHKFAPAKPALFTSPLLTSDMKTYSTWTRYGQSKLANIYFTTELARRYPSITSVAIHPGGVATNLAQPLRDSHWMLATLADALTPLLATATTGSLNQTWAAVAPVVDKEWTKKEGASQGLRQVKSGSYYTPVAKEGGQSKVARDAEGARNLWEWTEKELTEKGY